MTSNEQAAKARDERRETDGTDDKTAKVEPRDRELTEKELGAVTGGDSGGYQTGGSGRRGNH